MNFPLQTLLPATAAAPLSPRPLWLAGGGVALLGATVLIGWYEHWTSVLEMFPGAATMKYNTALSFILAGFGVAFLTTRFKGISMGFGALVALLSVATCLEYWTTPPFGIDELFVTDYTLPAGAYPGRMSPVAASCFILIGAGLILAAQRVNRSWPVLAVGSLACIVGVVAGVAILGYCLGIRAAFAWDAITPITMQTAAGFAILSVALLGWARDRARREKLNLAGWLPTVGSATLMAMLAFVSVGSLAQLENSLAWREHTYEVLLSAQALFTYLTDARTATLAYALNGDAKALEPYFNGVKNTPLQLTKLRFITKDNVSQEPRLDRLATDIDADFRYAGRLLEARDALGIEAVMRLESSSEGQLLMEHTRADMHAFTAEERRLVVRRAAKAKLGLAGTVRFLIFGSVFASALLVFAHLSTSAATRRRRRAEATLHAVSALQTAIINVANYAIIGTSVDGVITTFNSTAERWLGYTAADVIGHAAPDAWHDSGEMRARAQPLSLELGYAVTGFFEILVARARLGGREESEWTLIRKDGSRFAAWLSVTAQYDDNNIVGYVCVISDISERKEQESELRMSEARFRHAFADAPTGMALVSVAGRWLRVNRALCDMLGYSDRELLDMDVQSVTYRDDLEPTNELLRQALAGQDAPSRLEKRYVRKDGSVVFTNLSVTLVRDPNGLPLYFVSQIEDITQRVDVDRIKSEFISTVNHELRTPLTSIRGALGLLEAGALGALSDKALPLVRIAHQNCERLVRIINDILDVEKISAGKVEMRFESVPLTAFLEEALAVSEPYGVKHSVRFILEAPPASASVFADRDRLMQVMANLLSNGAKFSPPGAAVRVRASVHGSWARIEVEDHGTGIPAAFRARVFEKFAQADSTTSRQFEGPGLGLSITRELITAMGGTIGFTTISGQGTTFYLELPQATQTRKLTAEPALS